MHKILRINPKTNAVRGYDLIANESYSPTQNEIEVPESTPRKTLENAIRVDPSTDPVTIITEEEWRPIKPVDRVQVSKDTRDAILAAKEKGDTQAQIDHILDILDVIDL